MYGLKEALQDDPGGTAAALAKDGLVAAGTALAGYLAYDEIKGDDDKGKSAPAVPPIQADTVVINQGSGSLDYNVSINEGAR